MGPFSAPREIADRSKIARLRDNSDFDPRKMPSWRGLGKNMKIWWKNDAKMEGFWWLGTTFGVILFAYFTLFRFSKKIEKSMPKGRPKVVIFDPKCDLGRSRVDLSDVFWRFWKIRKIDDFWMSLWTSKSRLKIEPWGAKGRKRCCEPWPSRAFWSPGLPGRRP